MLAKELDVLRDAFRLNGEKEPSEYADDCTAQFRKLFDLWDGFDYMSRISAAAVDSDTSKYLEQIEELMLSDVNGKRISDSPLFEDVVFGNKSGKVDTIEDSAADLLRVLQSMESVCRADQTVPH